MKLIVNPPTPWPNWQAPVGTEKRILPGGAGPLAGWLIIERAQNTLPDAAILTSTRGYMPQLEPFFGAGAFDEGNEQLRFDHFVHRSGTRLAHEMRDAWAAIQAERPGATDGALAAPAAAIGIDVASGRVHSKFQRALTAEREAACYADVDARMRRLPARDQRRLAWLSKDVFSQSFVAALPTPECVLPNAEFAEVTTAYLGLPSPACSPLAGRTFRGHALDVYGNVLSSTQTKGAHWEDQHDSIARLFVAQTNENGLAADYEPTDAFIGVIPRAQRHAFYALRRSTQHSITPDARVQLAPGDDAYYDAKTVHVNGARYSDTSVLRLLPTKSACGGRSLAHMRKPAVREAEAGAWHHGLAPNERALSLARRPSRAGGPNSTRAAWRARAANAPAAPPPHRERVRWPLSCAHAQAGRARGQGRRVPPRPCTERESPVASAAAF